MSHLFDPEPFTNGTPHQPRKQRSAPSAPEVVADGRWKLFTNHRGAHIRKGLTEHGATVALCGVSGTVLSVAPGTKLPGCPKCIKLADDPRMRGVA